MIGPNRYAAVITAFLVNIPALIATAFPIRYVSDDTSYFLFVFTLLLLVLINIGLIKATITDPGYLPRSRFVNRLLGKPRPRDF